MHKTFRDLRKDAGFNTQEKFCTVANLTRGSVAKWETGTSYPRPQMLPRLAILLNVSEGEIISAIMATKKKSSEVVTQPLNSVHSTA